MKLEDNYGRILDYVRISITDRCNFRCRYCMPENGVQCLEHEKIMRYEDILFLCRTLREAGVKRIRFTGGEPLVRRGFIDFLEKFRSELPDMAVALTTNGTMLKPIAQRLGRLSLDGVSISLDSLRPDRFRDITRCGDIGPVIEGIEALASSMDKIKINTVLIKGFNDDELPELLAFCREKGVLLRLIEFMPLDKDVWREDSFISVDEILDSLPDRDRWVPEGRNSSPQAGPATYYKNMDTGQRLGLIAAVSHHFCEHCNRLRITASGEMRPCLFSKDGVNLMSFIRDRDSSGLLEALSKAAEKKPQRWMDIASGEKHMSQIGG